MPLTPSCAILLSRQPLRPCRATPWVKAMLAAVEWAAGEGLTVNTSVGTTVWDLVTVACARTGARLRVFVPLGDGEPFDALRGRFVREYELNTGACEWVPASCPGRDRSALMQARDQALVAAAGTLVPVSVRPRGAMEALVAATGAGVRIIREFAVPYSARGESLKYGLTPEEMSGQARGIGREYLVHWTRTSNGPWPGETVASFCRALLDSDTYPRSAFAGVRNMLATGRIAGSPRHMPGDTPCVSFTGKSPSEFAPLMRWRARYREMSFEPYGIGIERSAALAAGVRPVAYGPGRERSPETPLWLRQSEGRITLWRDEDEYRCKGDLLLSRIPQHALVCFCRERAEAQALATDFGVRVIPVCGE